MERERERVKPLSGVPYYHIVLAKTNLSPRYALVLGPSKNMCSDLPSDNVPTVLNCGGKSWDVTYHGHNKSFKKFKDWRKFAVDNCLKIGDACIFELIENSKDKIIFQVQILRGDIGYIPSEVPETGETGSVEDPIIIL